MMGVLERIIEKRLRRLESEKRRRPLRDIKSALRDTNDPPRDFLSAIKRGQRIRLIAEMKKASPSKGMIRPDFDPAKISAIYAEKADAISVLTEEEHFHGSLSYIAIAKANSTLPALRKDFIVDEYQIWESRLAGADAILLIASALDKARSAEYLSIASELGMAVLFEVHDEAELATALDIKSPIIGVNNRDLRTLETDLGTVLRLRPMIPKGVILVSESGIGERGDVLRLEDAGIDAVLVGTAITSAPDMGRKMDELMGRP